METRDHGWQLDQHISAGQAEWDMASGGTHTAPNGLGVATQGDTLPEQGEWLRTPPTHSIGWEPGSAGKGYVTNDGEVHTWNTDDNGRPHHPEYMVGVPMRGEQLDRVYRQNRILTHPFTIGPDGAFSWTWDQAPGKPAPPIHPSDVDPRLTSLFNDDEPGEWRFGADNGWHVTESDFHPDDTFYPEIAGNPGRFHQRVVVGNYPTRELVVGQPGTHHGDLIHHHGFDFDAISQLPRDERGYVEPVEGDAYTWTSDHGPTEFPSLHYGWIEDGGYGHVGPKPAGVTEALHAHGLIDNPDGSKRPIGVGADPWHFGGIEDGDSLQTSDPMSHPRATAPAPAEGTGFETPPGLQPYVEGGPGKGLLLHNGKKYAWATNRFGDGDPFHADAMNALNIDESKLGEDSPVKSYMTRYDNGWGDWPRLEDYSEWEAKPTVDPFAGKNEWSFDHGPVQIGNDTALTAKLAWQFNSPWTAQVHEEATGSVDPDYITQDSRPILFDNNNKVVHIGPEHRYHADLYRHLGVPTIPGGHQGRASILDHRVFSYNNTENEALHAAAQALNEHEGHGDWKADVDEDDAFNFSHVSAVIPFPADDRSVQGTYDGDRIPFIYGQQSGNVHLGRPGDYHYQVDMAHEIPETKAYGMMYSNGKHEWYNYPAPHAFNPQPVFDTIMHHPQYKGFFRKDALSPDARTQQARELDERQFRDLPHGPVDEWDFTAKTAAAPMVVTPVDTEEGDTHGQESGHPYLYTPDSGKLYVGSNGSQHWDLIEHVPELQQHYNLDERYGRPPEAQTTNHQYGRVGLHGDHGYIMHIGPQVGDIHDQITNTLSNHFRQPLEAESDPMWDFDGLLPHWQGSTRMALARVANTTVGPSWRDHPALVNNGREKTADAVPGDEDEWVDLIGQRAYDEWQFGDSDTLTDHLPMMTPPPNLPTNTSSNLTPHDAPQSPIPSKEVDTPLDCLPAQPCSGAYVEGHDKPHTSSLASFLASLTPSDDEGGVDQGLDNTGAYDAIVYASRPSSCTDECGAEHGYCEHGVHWGRTLDEMAQLLSHTNTQQGDVSDNRPSHKRMVKVESIREDADSLDQENRKSYHNGQESQWNLQDGSGADTLYGHDLLSMPEAQGGRSLQDVRVMSDQGSPGLPQQSQSTQSGLVGAQGEIGSSGSSGAALLHSMSREQVLRGFLAAGTALSSVHTKEPSEVNKSKTASTDRGGEEGSQGRSHSSVAGLGQRDQGQDGLRRLQDHVSRGSVPSFALGSSARVREAGERFYIRPQGAEAESNRGDQEVRTGLLSVSHETKLGERADSSPWSLDGDSQGRQATKEGSADSAKRMGGPHGNRLQGEPSDFEWSFSKVAQALPTLYHNWQEGEPGKGLYYADRDEMHTWPVNNEEDGWPWHQEYIRNTLGKDAPMPDAAFFIHRNGEVDFHNPGAGFRHHEAVLAKDPRFHLHPMDEEAWKFGGWADGLSEMENDERVYRPWRPGTRGKFIITPNEIVHHWQTEPGKIDEVDGAPYHVQYQMDNNLAVQRTPEGDAPGWTFGWIHPDGHIEHITDDPDDPRAGNHGPLNEHRRAVAIAGIPGANYFGAQPEDPAWKFGSSDGTPREPSLQDRQVPAKISEWDFSKTAYANSFKYDPSMKHGKGCVLESGTILTWPTDERGTPGHGQYLEHVTERPRSAFVIDGNEFTPYGTDEDNAYIEQMTGLRNGIAPIDGHSGWSFSKTASEFIIPEGYTFDPNEDHKGLDLKDGRKIRWGLYDHPNFDRTVHAAIMNKMRINPHEVERYIDSSLGFDPRTNPWQFRAPHTQQNFMNFARSERSKIASEWDGQTSVQIVPMPSEEPDNQLTRVPVVGNGGRLFIGSPGDYHEDVHRRLYEGGHELDDGNDYHGMYYTDDGSTKWYSKDPHPAYVQALNDHVKSLGLEPKDEDPSEWFFGKVAGKLEWLESRPDKLMQTEEGRQFFDNLKANFHNPKTDPLFPWIWREYRKGHIQLTDRTSLSMLDDHGAFVGWMTPASLNHMADWYADKRNPTRQGVDLMQLSAHDMTGKIHEWEEHTRNKDVQERLDGGKVLKTLSNGWTVRELEPADLDFEGQEMGHCVGGDGYRDAVRGGGTKIISLRDPKGLPHATMELEEDGWSSKTGENPWTIEQIQGKSNEIPKPEYQAMLKEWITSLPENQRPKWKESEDPITSIGEITGEDAGRYGEDGWGGYQPHGDYGIHTPQRPTDYEDVLEGIHDQNRSWRGDGSYDPAHGEALYEHALKRNEVPELAKAHEEYQSKAWDKLNESEEQNYEWIGYPGEYEDDPQRWEEVANERGMPGWSGKDAYNQAYENYAEARDELAQNIPQYQAANHMGELLAPHWNSQTGGFTNEKPGTTFSSWNLG